MPSLTPGEQEQLLGGENTCPFCFQKTTKNYCRQCDEFYFEGHDSDCQEMDKTRPYSQNHVGHRTY